jgi:HNH endonuclease
VNPLPAEGESLSPRARKGDYKINSETGCWEWQKGRNRNGYGMGSFTSLGIATQWAHRAYYMVGHGVMIAPGYEDGVIDHLCRNPPCVNPAHLELVRPAENTQRGDAAKITMDDAREIRRRIVAGELMTPLSEEYGVSIHTIHWIAEDIMWREDYNAPRQPVRPAGVVCAECGEPITSGKRNKRFCSPKHRDLYNGRRSNRRRRGKDPDGSDVRAYSRALRDSQGPKEGADA